MKATFVLLANTDVHNIIRKISWEFHRKYCTGTQHASLPPNVSLKQPFSISNLSELEKYLDGLAISIQPFDIKLTELQIRPLSFGGAEYGILWVDVEESGTLRSLHNRLNTELFQRFGNTTADFDGETYHFHMTMMIGGQIMDIYRKFHNEIPNTNIDMCYTVREMAMFVYDEPLGPHSDYLCYKILPIGK